MQSPLLNGRKEDEGGKDNTIPNIWGYNPRDIESHKGISYSTIDGSVYKISPDGALCILRKNGKDLYEILENGPENHRRIIKGLKNNRLGMVAGIPEDKKQDLKKLIQKGDTEGIERCILEHGKKPQSDDHLIFAYRIPENENYGFLVTKRIDFFTETGSL